MPDFIPSSDDQFDHFVAVDLAAAVKAPANPLQLTPQQIADFTAALAKWAAAWTPYLAGKPAFDTLRTAKDTARLAMEAAVRALNTTVQANPAVPDTAKSAASLPIHKTTRTPVGPIDTAPVLYKVDNEHLLQRLWFSDSATPGSKAKPAGAAMLEIREQIVATGTPAPVDPDAMPFLANETKMPHRNDHVAADLGKTACYAARWVNTKGDSGPWSQITGWIIN